MSEDEQSWSYGAVSRNLDQGRLLVCAMVLVKPSEHWPMDDHAFARAVDAAKAKGNALADRIPVYNGVMGRHCPDFDEMLHLALHACLVEYLAPSFTRMHLCAGPRTVKHLMRDVSEKDIEDAKALVQEFWDEVHGRVEREVAPERAS